MVMASEVVAPTESVTLIVSYFTPNGMYWAIVSFALPAVEVSHVIPGANWPVTTELLFPVPELNV